MKEIRETLVKKLMNYNGNKPINLSELGYSKADIQKILFDTYKAPILDDDNYPIKGKYEIRKEFSEILYPILKKIDYSNVSFNHFNCSCFDFSGFIGVKINPQKVFFKRLSSAKCSGIKFVGSFNNVKIGGTDFTGSKGAKINLKKVYSTDLSHTKFGSAKVKRLGE